MKNYVGAMNRIGDGFRYLRQKFPWISVAKTKEGIFFGSQIKELMSGGKFEVRERMKKTGWEASNCFLTTYR
jgi:hypothetical protein